MGGEYGCSIALIHKDSSALRQKGVFYVVVNNADHDGSHKGWTVEAARAENLSANRVSHGLQSELGQNRICLRRGNHLTAAPLVPHSPGPSNRWEPFG